MAEARNRSLRFGLLLAACVLGGCGFHLRGHNALQAEFPFKSVYVKSRAETPLTADLRHYLALNKLTVMPAPEAAAILLEVVTELADKQILSISSAGRVQEFQLRYIVTIRAYDNNEREWLPAEEVTLYRTLTYDDAQVLAKEQEEILLYRDMRLDAVQQIMRRLGHARPETEHP